MGRVELVVAIVGMLAIGVFVLHRGHNEVVNGKPVVTIEPVPDVSERQNLISTIDRINNNLEAHHAVIMGAN